MKPGGLIFIKTTASGQLDTGYVEKSLVFFSHFFLLRFFFFFLQVFNEDDDAKIWRDRLKTGWTLDLKRSLPYLSLGLSFEWWLMLDGPLSWTGSTLVWTWFLFFACGECYFRHFLGGPLRTVAAAPPRPHSTAVSMALARVGKCSAAHSLDLTLTPCSGQSPPVSTSLHQSPAK